MQPFIYDVINFAIQAHDGQKRKTNEKHLPYICHPIRVAKLLDSHGANTETIIAAILHDVVEDTEYTLKDIHNFLVQNYVTLMVSNHIISIIDALTVRKNEKKIDAMKRLTNKQAPIEAIIIKAADMIDNYQNAIQEQKEKNRERAKILVQVYNNREYIMFEYLFRKLKIIFGV